MDEIRRILIKHLDDDIRKINIVKHQGYDDVKIREHVKKAYKLANRGKFNRCIKQLENHGLLSYLNKFLDEDATDLRLDVIVVIIKTLKILYENSVDFIGDKLYDKMLDKFKRFRDEPVEAKLFVVGRRELNTAHEFPLLRGTIDKARYVYTKDIPDNDSDAQSVEEFLEKCFKHATNPVVIRLSLKYDGVSAIITIDAEGKIKSIITRGEESNGADLTHLFNHLKYKMHAKYVRHTVGLKTELIMTRDNYNEYCKEKKYKYSNLRSAVISIISASEGAKYSKYLSPVPLQAESTEGKQFCATEWDNYYKQDVPFQFYLISAEKKKDALAKIKAFIDGVQKSRDALGFAIDGVVIDVLNEEVREALGRKNAINRYQVAYKFPAISATTRVTGVEFTAGRTGQITPIVYYEWIELNGTNHNHSTLSSYDRFKELEIKVGDIIEVTYNNDVMPYVNKDKNNPINIENDKPILQYPKHCPECFCKIEKEGANYFCNNLSCSGKTVGGIEFFCKTMGIRDISDKTWQKFYDEGLITDIPTLFNPPSAQMLQIEGFGQKKLKGFLKQIDKLKAKEIDEATLCAALGIAGIETCKSILSNTTLNEIIKDQKLLYNVVIPSVGDKKKDSFLQSLRVELSKESIQKLTKILKVVPYIPEDFKMAVCFTGFRDKNIKAKAESQGIKVQDSFKGISYLVVATENHSSPKVTEAKERGIKIITRDEFVEMIGGK